MKYPRDIQGRDEGHNLCFCVKVVQLLSIGAFTNKRSKVSASIFDMFQRFFVGARERIAKKTEYFGI